MSKLLKPVLRDSYATYYKEVSHYPPISIDEERMAITAMLLGDEEAKNRLITANLRYVVSVAIEYANQGVPIEDLISEGNLGLIRAAKRYDYTRNIKFITYASYWIKQAMLKALMEQPRLVHLPTNKINLISRREKVVDKLTQQLDRHPTEDELEDVLGATSKDISSDFNYMVISDLNETDLPVYTLENKPEQFKDDLDELLLETNLSERDKDIIYMYYGIGYGSKLTLEEIGNYYHISKERVRQIKYKAIKKLRTCKNINRLREYL